MTAANAPSVAPERAPSVLAVLVVHDEDEWLRECLQALASQTYPRLGVLAIDDASSGGSSEILLQALGEARVIRHEARVGFARSFGEVMEHPAAAAADHLLLLHGDVALDSEAVARLVEATRLGGDPIGLVGCKVVEWDEPRRLRDVGRSADRFGHPYSPLQADEIDQGQFDRVLEVLAVDSCAVLVAREVWSSIGLFDERLGDDDGDLDLCWRARVAGWRVLMTPLARSRHRGAGELDDRPGQERSRRHGEDRAALACVLKNYSLPTLLWVGPLGFVLTGVRAAFLVLTRRFDEAYDLVAAVGWNVTHLGGTVSRRRVVQKSRRVKDHQLRRFMESAGLRLPRWFQTAERIIEEQLELEEDETEPATRRLRHRTASLFATHPVIVTSVIAVFLGLLAVRHLFGGAALTGGVVPAFPATPGGFFHALTSGVRATGLGGPLSASPALGLLGGLSFLSLGSTALAQKVILAAAPALAAILCYRAAVRLTGRPGPSSLAAAAYGLSALMLWAFSEGRIELLVAMGVVPALLERFEVAFTAEEPVDGKWRFIAGVAVTLALGVAFSPAVLLPVALMLLVDVTMARRRVEGLTRIGVAAVGAAVLLFPFVTVLFAGGGAALTSQVGAVDPAATLRLALGGGIGAWAPAAFLPLAAVLGLALVREERRGPALRASVLAVAGTALAWLSVAGYLPPAMTNASAYATVAASAEAMLVALGLASVLGGLGREAFGFRQVATAALGAVLALGFLLQTVAIGTGEWGVGPSRVEAAWAVVDSTATGSFRVLWLGPDDGRPFPAPGGDPAGVVEAGDATLAWGLTDRRGIQALDIGRPLAGPGAEALSASLSETLGGTTTHAGALMAPFAIRYVVAREGTLPPAALARLEMQADLDLVPATGLLIWTNAAAIPPASVLEVDDAESAAILDGGMATIQMFQPPSATPLAPTPDGWEGAGGSGSLAVASTEYDDGWTLQGSDQEPARAFGWATSFDVSSSPVSIRYGAGLPRVVTAWLLAALWVAALWITRKPVRR